MFKLMLIATLTFSFALPAAAQTGAVVAGKSPGAAGIAQTVKVSATITAIDKATRSVTMKGPKGREVRNFAQLKVGDQVEAQYVESLAIELKKGGGLPVGATEQAAAMRAKEGAAPGAAGARQVTLVGDVIDLDPATQTVTVRGKERTVDLKIRDPEQFKLVAKGDQIQATYTEAVGIAVSPKK